MSDMHLYKYTSPCNARYVGSCTLRFSPPKVFNDPFDCVPDYSALRSMPDFKALEEKVRAESLQLASGDFAQAAEIEAETWMTPTIRGAMEKYLDRLLDDRDANFRVLSLSKHDPTTTEAALMMGHYGEDHRGFAYEFDASHPWFEAHRFSVNPSRDYRAVTYQLRRPGLLLDGREGLFFKSPPWSYEAEVRLVRLIKDSSNDLSGPDNSIANYPGEMLTAVALGCMATDQTEKVIRAGLSANPKLRHVKLLRLRRDYDQYRFNAFQI